MALGDGEELCVCDLGWITMRAENLVGHHLRALRLAGLADSRRDGKIVFYRVRIASCAICGDPVVALVIAGLAVRGSRGLGGGGLRVRCDPLPMTPRG
jgi:DNA-binding transcriptional ArsR family regulator